MRAVYKGCKKFMYGNEKYTRLKTEKKTRKLDAAERAAGYSEAGLPRLCSPLQSGCRS
jgi:pyoverdine/dityrosine biosynthesis protein Dit1